MMKNYVYTLSHLEDTITNRRLVGFVYYLLHIILVTSLCSLVLQSVTSEGDRGYITRGMTHHYCIVLLPVQIVPRLVAPCLMVTFRTHPSIAALLADLEDNLLYILTSRTPSGEVRGNRHRCSSEQ